jgi:hypothetical protein
MIQLKEETQLNKVKKLKEMLKNNLPIFVKNNIKREILEIESIMKRKI